jgi:hypothetical protein
MQGRVLYTTHKEIVNRLATVISQKNIQEADIMEWCQQAENEHIIDMNVMWRYMNVPLQVYQGKALMPCNVHRLLDVYTSPNSSSSRLNFAHNSGYIFFDQDFEGETVYINYFGMPIDEEGVPMIARGHETACELYCLTKIYFEDSILGRINPNQYENWGQRFNNAVISIKQSMRYVDRKKLEVFDALKYSVMRIGRLRLASNDIYQ